jgi:hypothetical protein
VQNNRGYAPGLAWVRSNQKLAFHIGDTIIKAPSFLLPLDGSMIHHRSYYDMRECNRRDVNNPRKSQPLKYDRASQADELALMTNTLGLVSMLSNRTLLFQPVF